MGSRARDMGRDHSRLARCVRISSAVGIRNLHHLQGLCLLCGLCLGAFPSCHAVSPEDPCQDSEMGRGGGSQVLNPAVALVVRRASWKSPSAGRLEEGGELQRGDDGDSQTG